MATPVNDAICFMLASDLERGFSLPASWYTDPAVLDLERERIFRRSWQYVGRTVQLSAVGDYVTGVGGDVPVVIVRGPEGLSGFINVCRHRRHLVMSGAGNCKIMQCPYHAWGYDLDGRLKAAPRADREPDFQREHFPLLPVRVETWGPLVFANLDRDAHPLDYYLGELPAKIAEAGIDLERLEFRAREDWHGAANWKTMVENYLECYHCPVAHPGFSAVVNVDPDAYRLQAHGWCSSQCAPTRGPDRSGEIVAEAQFHFLWPNFTINIHGGQPNLSIDVWLPDGPSASRGFTEFFFYPDVADDFAERLMSFSRQVGAEDAALTDSVQLGLRAGIPEQGRFLLNTERLILHFQKLVLSALST